MALVGTVAEAGPEVALLPPAEFVVFEFEAAFA
jgi:hypothetical protein